MKTPFTLSSLLITGLIIFTCPFITYANSYGQTATATVISQRLSIDKMVSRTANTDFSDNLSASDYRFKPGQEVYFRITVKNLSKNRLTKISVTDELPDTLEFLKIDNKDGSFDKINRTVTINAGTFNPDQEKPYIITAKIASQSALPSQSGLFCPTNRVTATVEDELDADTSQFCVEKQVEGVSKIPTTGAGILILPVILFALAGRWLSKSNGSLYINK